MGAPSPGSAGFRILVRASLPSLMERTEKEMGRKRKQEKRKEKRKGISMYACWFLATQTQRSESKVAIVLLLASSGTIQLCVLGGKELNPNPNILRRSPYRSDSDRYECNLKLPPGQKQSWTLLSGERAKGRR